MEWVLLGLILLAIPAAGVAGFFMALNLRRRVTQLETQVLRLASGQPGLAAAPFAPAPAEDGIATPPSFETDTPTAAPATSERADDTLSPETAPSSEISGEPAPADRPEPEETPAEAPPAPAIAARGVDLEEKLGARWAVWVGGIALALGGILLARYSIEQGYFGPGARTVAGALLALGLIAAGEWLRRRDSGLILPGFESAHIPGVLTAAGTATAFATTYAAHALYGFLGPAAAFVLLGAIGGGAMVASALHGPALAALGLLGAFAAPLLVSSGDPRPWPVVLYLAVVAASAYGVARLRLWRWLALSAAGGAILWGMALSEGLGTQAALPLMVHAAVQMALAGLFLFVEPYRGTPDDEARIDGYASAALAGLALVAILAVAFPTAGEPRAIFGLGMLALTLALAWRVAPGALAGWFGAAIAAATLWHWPVARLAASEPVSVLPGPLVAPPQPEALTLYLAVAALSGIALLAFGHARLMRGPALRLPVAGAYAAAAGAGPLALLAIAYWRVTAFTPSVPFALAAVALAAAQVMLAGRLRAMDDGSSPAWRLALGTAATGCLAALALGLAFVLDKGMLTVALALAALGAAYVAARLDVPGLRYAVGVAALIVAARIAWNPAIAASGEIGKTPVFNWLLWGYGVPAVSFAIAARLLMRLRMDWTARLCEGLALILGALLFVFEIRHILHDGDPFARTSGHLDMGLIATVGLGFSLLLVKLDGLRPDPLYRVGGLVAGAITLALVGFGLVLFDNPLFDRQPVTGGPVLNSLLLAYALPAAMAAGLAWRARATRPRWYWGSAGAIALLLSLLYAVLEVRFLYQGPIVVAWRFTSQPELWTYSAVLLAIGVAFLALGLWRDWRLARLISAPYILLAVLKVFLIDMNNLGGALRALSFIGLGLALVGIGLAYQKLLARGRSAPPPAPPSTEGEAQG